EQGRRRQGARRPGTPPSGSSSASSSQGRPSASGPRRGAAGDWQSPTGNHGHAEGVNRISGPLRSGVMTSLPKPGKPSFSAVVESLDRQRGDGAHAGAQFLVSRDAAPVGGGADGQAVAGPALANGDARR